MSARGSSSNGGLPPPPPPASATLDDLQRAGADVPAGDLAPSPAAVGEADRGETSGERSVSAAAPSESRARAARRAPARAPLRRTSAETAAAFRATYHDEEPDREQEASPYVMLHVEHERFAAWERAAADRPVEKWLGMVGDKAANHVERSDSERQRGNKSRRRDSAAGRVTLKEGARLAGLSQHALLIQLASGAVPFERDAGGKVTIARADIRRVQRIGCAQVRVSLSPERRVAWERAAGDRLLREWLAELGDGAAGYQSSPRGRRMAGRKAEQAVSIGAREPAAAPPPAPAASHRDQTASKQLRGTVRWFNDAKGYGCIASEEGRDVFVHRSAIAGAMYPRLIEGQLVEYQVQQSANGPQVVKVTPLHAVAARSR